MARILIVGAGMAGLLAAQMLKRKHDVTVIEAQPELPNNHSAVLRFRTQSVGDVIGVDFKKVQVLKSYVQWRNPVADCLAYSQKCLGEYRSDRSMTDLTGVSQRYIAPRDLIEQLADGVNFMFERKFNLEFSAAFKADAIISTMPMHLLANIVDDDVSNELWGEVFEQIHGCNVIADVVGCDAYATVYVPDPTTRMNRVSLMGGTMIAEYSFPGETVESVNRFVGAAPLEIEARRAAHYLGLSVDHLTNMRKRLQRYSKIKPINDAKRKDFIHRMTDRLRIYSLGRFATWRPGLLLDDVVHDVRMIERMIGSSYFTNHYRAKD